MKKMIIAAALATTFSASAIAASVQQSQWGAGIEVETATSWKNVQQEAVEGANLPSSEYMPGLYKGNR